MDCNYINQSVSACALVYTHTHTAVTSSWICMWVAFWAASESLDFSDQWLPVDRRLSALQRPPCPNPLHILSNSQGGGHGSKFQCTTLLLCIFKPPFVIIKLLRSPLIHTNMHHSGWADVFSPWWSSESERDVFHNSVRQANEDNRDSQDNKKKDLRQRRGSIRKRWEQKTTAE